jgi:hypothetical protein
MPSLTAAGCRKPRNELKPCSERAPRSNAIGVRGMAVTHFDLENSARETTEIRDLTCRAQRRR